MGFGSVGDTFRASCTAGTHAGFSVGIDLWNAPPPALLTPPRRARCLSLFSHTECVSRVHDAQARRARMYACVCVRAARSSLFLLVTDAVRRPLPSVRIPSAIRGVTASFGWVRAKETDENRAGDEAERRGSIGGGRGEEFVKSLPRSLHPVISHQLAPYSYYVLSITRGTFRARTNISRLSITIDARINNKLYRAHL